MERNELNDEDIRAFEPTEKIGLVATTDEAGEPHVTLLSTIMGFGRRGLVLGEFSVGLSKANMRVRPKVGFLVMGLDLRMWRGRARWTKAAKEGPEYEAFNRKPMFRYNTYFGVNTAHYLDMDSVEGPERLPMARIVCSWIGTALRSAGRGLRSETPALTSYARGIFDAAASLSFLSWVDPEGYPRLAPIVQARTAGPGRVVFSPGAFGAELAEAPDRCRAAVFCMNLSMESVLARGEYRQPAAGPRGLGLVDIDWVYNSMPSCHGQAYPRPALEPVREF